MRHALFVGVLPTWLIRDLHIRREIGAELLTDSSKHPYMVLETNRGPPQPRTEQRADVVVVYGLLSTPTPANFNHGEAMGFPTSLYFCPATAGDRYASTEETATSCIRQWPSWARRRRQMCDSSGAQATPVIDMHRRDDKAAHCFQHPPRSAASRAAEDAPLAHRSVANEDGCRQRRQTVPQL